MVKLVWTTRIYSKNFISDFINKMKNIVGGRLESYEDMLNTAIEETNKEFNEKYPEAKNLKLDTETWEGDIVMVTITGEVDES